MWTVENTGTPDPFSELCRAEAAVPPHPCHGPQQRATQLRPICGRHREESSPRLRLPGQFHLGGPLLRAVTNRGAVLRWCFMATRVRTRATSTLMTAFPRSTTISETSPRTWRRLSDKLVPVWSSGFARQRDDSAAYRRPMMRLVREVSW